MPSTPSLRSDDIDKSSVDVGSEQVRILFVEDDESDVELARRELGRAQLRHSWQRVDNADQLRSALNSFSPDIVLCDFKMPKFDGDAALQIVKDCDPLVPFVFLSGHIGEQRAVEALHQGAADYVLKDNLGRLVPAIQRALRERNLHAAQLKHQKQIARLTRVLRMLSGINGIIVRIREHAMLLDEACRVAIDVGGYSSAIVMLRDPGEETLRVVAARGVDTGSTQAIQNSLTGAYNQRRSLIARVLRTGTTYVCNAPSDPLATATISELMVHTGFKSLIASPLLIDKTIVGIMILTAADTDVFSEEELRMLSEVCANLSFALHFMHNERAASRLSHFDSLTSLAKRPLLCERLGRVLSDLQCGAAIAVIDVEHLSTINDSFGRHIGDLLLQHVADRLRRYFTGPDCLAHLGGGTFAVIMQGSLRDNLIENLAQLIRAAFDQPFEFEGRDMPVVVRSGVAGRTRGDEGADELVQNAEAALHYARSRGQHQVLYSEDQHIHAVARLALEHKLRRALELNQFELHYQPKISVRTREIVGAEALLRWRDPERGLVPPATFLPLLEATGLIIDVGDWVVRQAADDCRRWLASNLPTVRVAVNISAVQLSARDFDSRFAELTHSWSTGYCGLDIEVTESALLDGSEAEVARLQTLRRAGIRIAIDDFGTGYSSLSRLATLPIDTLKIDRSFINRLDRDARGRTLTELILNVARAYDMDVIAEGVETADQLDLLLALGCDQAQGFLMSRPVSRDAFAALLKAGGGEFLLPPARR